MHPAASIIIFTTLSGAGFGLIGFVSLGFLGSDRTVLLAGAATAIGLAITGLLSSTFHLRNPQRAWRALSQWRSSWLSREGVLALATLAAFLVLAWCRVEPGWRFAALDAGVAGLAALTVLATAMIYASLKSVPLWHTLVTPACYLLFGAAGGGLLASLTVAVTGRPDQQLIQLTLFILVAAWLAKCAWWARAGRLGLAAAGHTPETATGLGNLGRVRLLEAPHTSPNYLMNEMVHRIGRKHAQKLRLISIVLGAAIPIGSLLIALVIGQARIMLVVATISHFIGVFAERWLFFAEAEHTVSLYYGHG